MSLPIPLAFVMSSFAPGGTERQMIELIERLDRARWRVHVACFHRRGDWFDRVRRAADVVIFPVTSFQRPGAFSRQLYAFARWCRTSGVAVAHTVDMPANIFGLTGAALAGVPVRVANRREIDPGRTISKLALQRATYAFAHAIVANSRAVAVRLEGERVPARKVTVIPNGSEIAAVHPPRGERPLRRIAVVANLRKEKGHDVLIDAAPLVLRRHPEIRFHIVGEGPERPQLVARAAARGVLAAFAFLGHRGDVVDELARADLFVLPSRSEAMPNAVMEAMAVGMPVIASDVGGVPELVEHEHTGLLVAPDDPEALAQAICRLVEDPASAFRLGQAARKAAAARPSFGQMVAAFESLYLKELTSRIRR